MESLAIPVLGLAVIDAVNPSALAVALWWLARPGATPRLLSYIAGILVAYLSLGIAMMLGAGGFQFFFCRWFYKCEWAWMAKRFTSHFFERTFLYFNEL